MSKSARWRIAKQEAKVQDMSAEFAEAVNKFGHPMRKQARNNMTVRVRNEMDEALRDLNKEQATLRSMMILSGK